KGLLLGLFFIAVGMSTNLALIRDEPLSILGLAVGLMVVKFALVFAMSRIARAPADTAQRLALAVSQGGEFAFVLFAAAAGLGVLDPRTAQLLIAVVAVSMLLSPPAFALQDRLLSLWGERHAAPEFDTISGPGNPVIIAGYGRVGQIL